MKMIESKKNLKRWNPTETEFFWLPAVVILTKEVSESTNKEIY